MYICLSHQIHLIKILWRCFHQEILCIPAFSKSSFVLNLISLWCQGHSIQYNYFFHIFFKYFTINVFVMRWNPLWGQRDILMTLTTSLVWIFQVQRPYFLFLWKLHCRICTGTETETLTATVLRNALCSAGHLSSLHLKSFCCLKGKLHSQHSVAEAFFLQESVFLQRKTQGLLTPSFTMTAGMQSSVYWLGWLCWREHNSGAIQHWSSWHFSEESPRNTRFCTCLVVVVVVLSKFLLLNSAQPL